MRKEGLRDSEGNVIKNDGEKFRDDCGDGHGCKSRVSAADRRPEAHEGIGWRGEEKSAGGLR